MTQRTQQPESPTVILVPGHWLGAWAWDEVLEQLVGAGLRAVPLTLPGLDADDPHRSSRTLEDQAAAIQAALDAAGGTAVLVAHSGANAPVSLVTDRNPEQIRRIVWVDSGPAAPGGIPTTQPGDTCEDVPLPSFDELGAQASLAGLTPEQLERFRTLAVPQPGPVAGATLHLSNPARRQVPTTLVCCSLCSAQVTELSEAGHPMFAEVAQLAEVDQVDLPTGHWPMWSRPADLARIIHDAAAR